MKNIKTSLIISLFTFVLAFEIFIFLFFKQLYPYGYEAVKYKIVSDFGLMYIHYISLFLGTVFSFLQFIFLAKKYKRKYSLMLVILFSLVTLVCFFYIVRLNQYPIFIYVIFFYYLSLFFARNESKGV